jgi:hypothetical protein
LIAQWPAFAGFACIAAGLGYVWYAKTYPPHLIYPKVVILLMSAGIVLLGFWAFSSDRGNSNS